MLTCNIDLSEFRSLVGRTLDVLERDMGRAVELAALEGAEEARRVGRYQDRSGRLRAGIIARFVSNSGRSVTWEILSPASYSKFIESGTRPHVIRARGDGYLAFQVGGRTVFARQVNHPGTHAYPFAGPGMQQAERTLVRELEQLPAELGQVWS